MVAANIPLLLGMEYQKKWGKMIDLREQEVHIKRSKNKFEWMLPIQGLKRLEEETADLIGTMDLETKPYLGMRRHIIKTHKILCHKSKERLITLFQAV